ncbi:MAG: maltose alpha-D-glucosyltransferase [Acidobacteriaceae bacterium]
MKKPCSATDPLWYKDAIIYELHVRAFADSNADGIGDFQGLISKLDYLQELGVTCLWLLPFFPSPLRDDGYDIADYTNVNPAYGTIADFQQFLSEAHARNLQVMIELVINHTSDQHPWFQRARLAPKDSPDRDMYVWSDTATKFDGVRIIFTDTEKSNWTWDEVAQQYYWHRFFSHQPDLNFDNPRVMDEVLKAMRFWLDMGVDGLRLDAIPYIIERDGTSCENLPETHDRIKQIRAAIDAEYENRLVLAEANMWPADVRPYFGDGDECNMAFHFPLMPRIYMALRQEDRLPITDIMAQTPAIPDNCQWGLFLRNHDELTLEMVTDDERDYMNLAYAADTRMRINVGIRRRLAPLMDNNRRRIELLNSLLLSFPGTPIMYYGDEIGMGDNIYLGDRNGVRTPMQWNSDRNAGFSKAVPAKLYFPVIMDPIWGYQAINVEAQQSDASSLLHWTRNMIALRKIFQVFGRGTLEFLHPENRKVLAYIRDYTDPLVPSADANTPHTETVLCVANLSRFAQPVQLDLTKYAGRQPVEMLGYVPFPIIDGTPYAITLAPYSFFWLELQPGPTSTSSSRPESLRSEDGAERPAGPASHSLLTLLNESGAEILDTTLPTYIAHQRWFGGKSRTIRSTRIVSTFPIEPTSAIALVELTYTDTTTDLYQLPLAIAAEAEAAQLQSTTPSAIIATLNNFTLIDATNSPTFRANLLQHIITTNTPTTPGDPSSPMASSSAKVGGPPPTSALPTDLTSTQSSALDPTRLADVPSRLSSAEQSNTSIFYDDLAILKLFRHLRTGENPDVEIGRFLTDAAHFPHIPAYLGDLHLAADNTTLAFLQTFSPNLGDGWSWTLTDLDRFFTEVANTPAPATTQVPQHLSPELHNPEQKRAATTQVPQHLSPELHNPEQKRAATTQIPQGFSAELHNPEQERAATTQVPQGFSLGSHNQELKWGALAPATAPYLAAAELLGVRTAELHLALATPTDDPAFAAEPTTPELLANDRQRIHQQVTTALDALQSSLKSPTALTPEAATLAAELLAHRDALLTRIASLNGDAARFGNRIRIHGDYHLGQLLCIQTKTHPDFLIIDFEGEPARPLAERRRKQPGLRDVAGMLRSFSYAAHTALQPALKSNPDNAPNLAAWAAAWESAVTAAFLRGYNATIAANPSLTPQDASVYQLVLQVSLLEKACYELLYELNNRPTWLVIPLKGILAIVHNGA